MHVVTLPRPSCRCDRHRRRRPRRATSRREATRRCTLMTPVKINHLLLVTSLRRSEFVNDNVCCHVALRIAAAHRNPDVVVVWRCARGALVPSGLAPNHGHVDPVHAVVDASLKSSKRSLGSRSLLYRCGPDECGSNGGCAGVVRRIRSAEGRGPLTLPPPSHISAHLSRSRSRSHAEGRLHYPSA